MAEAATEGVELPSPDTEEFGGFAYELIYLSYRIKPQPHLVDEELERFREVNFEPQKERLEELMRPGDGEWLAYERASEVLARWEAYGFPRAGGYLDQSAEWLYVLTCARAAKERAESQTNREEAWEAEQKRRSAEQEPAPTY